jgi:hypothetical protein
MILRLSVPTAGINPPKRQPLAASTLRGKVQPGDGGERTIEYSYKGKRREGSILLIGERPAML